MRRLFFVVLLLAVVGCGGGPSYEGTWVGEVTATGNAAPGVYPATWAIKSAPNLPGVVISSTSLCTQWYADINGPLMTWAGTCSPYSFVGSAELRGDSFHMTGSLGAAYLVGDFSRQ